MTKQTQRHMYLTKREKEMGKKKFHGWERFATWWCINRRHVNWIRILVNSTGELGNGKVWNNFP